jgi:hypothetical protein
MPGRHDELANGDALPGEEFKRLAILYNSAGSFELGVVEPSSPRFGGEAVIGGHPVSVSNKGSLLSN